MSKLKLGIIGMSEGNGHPYSWSAILNGFDPNYMKDCPFQSIPAYLNQHSSPDNTNPFATVTHIWCQDRNISNHISASSKIPHIVNDYRDMIGTVDAVLLARDDAENHYSFAKPFLQAGLPIYIDKLIAYTQQEAHQIYDLQMFEGQIFTGSALAYSPNFVINDLATEIGELIYVDACVMNTFKKYGIHIIEPVLKMMGSQGKIDTIHKINDIKHDIILLTFENKLKISFSALGTPYAPIAIRLFGTKGYKLLSHVDTFHAFKNALNYFIQIIKREKLPDSKDFVIQIVKIIEDANNA
jgi:predicted dehydrogenase